MLYIQWQIRKIQIIWHHHDSAGAEHKNHWNILTHIICTMCLLLWISNFLEILEKSSRALCCRSQPKPPAKLTVRAMGKSGRAWFDGHPHGGRIQDSTMPHVLYSLYNCLDLLKQSKNTHIPHRFRLSMVKVLNFEQDLKETQPFCILLWRGTSTTICRWFSQLYTCM